MTTERVSRPAILLVDDEPDNLRSSIELALDARARVRVLHPSDIVNADVRKARLILVDYKLDHWRERIAQPPAFGVRTGMALAAVLREVADELNPGRFTAVALHTAHLREASGRVRPPYARHVLARLNNLEWVFEKDDRKMDAQSSFCQMIQLARAAERLDSDWPLEASASVRRARELLGLCAGDDWVERSWQEVRKCQPPIYQLATSSDRAAVHGNAHGVFFLRWLLHEVLPYPSFLWDVYWVAARLRIQVDDLKELMASDSALARELNQFKYAGILANYLGPRWWRIGVEDYAWEIAGRSSSRAADFESSLRGKAGRIVEMVEPLDPVVCLDEKLMPSGVASPEEAVRLRPDYWPHFADAAWIRIDKVVPNQELRAMVDPLDMYRLDPHG